MCSYSSCAHALNHHRATQTSLPLVSIPVKPGSSNQNENSENKNTKLWLEIHTSRYLHCAQSNGNLCTMYVNVHACVYYVEQDKQCTEIYTCLIEWKNENEIKYII